MGVGSQYTLLSRKNNNLNQGVGRMSVFEKLPWIYIYRIILCVIMLLCGMRYIYVEGGCLNIPYTPYTF